LSKNATTATGGCLSPIKIPSCIATASATVGRDRAHPPAAPNPTAAPIDKSQLGLAKPERPRAKAHQEFADGVLDQRIYILGRLAAGRVCLGALLRHLQGNPTDQLMNLGSECFTRLKQIRSNAAIVSICAVRRRLGGSY
jgi:hypothetical protein